MRLRLAQALTAYTICACSFIAPAWAQCQAKIDGHATKEELVHCYAEHPLPTKLGISHLQDSAPLPPMVHPGSHAVHSARRLTPAQAMSLAVTFASGSPDLTGDAPATLEAVGRALTTPALQDVRFRIEGHTDTMGSVEDNLQLSQRRAETVARYLESTYGIDAARLEVVGVGKGQLLYPTPDQTPEERNRRVVVVKLPS